MREPSAANLSGLSTEAAMRLATRILRDAGIAEAASDVRLLTAAALGSSKLELIRDPARVIAAEEGERLAGFLARRLKREPVSRILGTREFYGREFVVGPATLDPRPDTETLVELALEVAAEQGWRDRPMRLLDVGTGSGCIALTLLAELPQATALATDIDAEALRVAADNAARLGLAGRIDFKQCWSLAGVDGTFDMVVSNPPYIPTVEIAGLDPEVRDYDPMAALDGGVDGLDIIRELARDAGSVIESGWLVLEVGAGQAEKALEILDPRGACKTRVKYDLGGHQRCVAVWTHR